MLELAIQLYSEVLVSALPFAVGIAICDLIATSFMRVAFGGRLWFGK